MTDPERKPSIKKYIYYYGERRFKQPPLHVIAFIETVSIETLAQMLEKLLDVDCWDELLPLPLRATTAALKNKPLN